MGVGPEHVRAIRKDTTDAPYRQNIGNELLDGHSIDYRHGRRTYLPEI